MDSWKRRFYEWSNRNWWQIQAALVLLCAVLAVLLLTGCGWTSQERTRTRERTRATGTVAAVPVDITVERVAESETQASGESDDGLWRALGDGVGQALAGGSNLATGGAAGLAVGLLGMGWAWLKKRQADQEAATAGRQRDEVIEGVEASKAKLADPKHAGAWDELTGTLERKQSRDTIEYIRSKTP